MLSEKADGKMAKHQRDTFDKNAYVKKLRTHGVIERAAKQLGVSRETIRYHRLKDRDFDRRVQKAIYSAKTAR